MATSFLRLFYRPNLKPLGPDEHDERVVDSSDLILGIGTTNLWRRSDCFEPPNLMLRHDAIVIGGVGAHH